MNGRGFLKTLGFLSVVGFKRGSGK